MRRPTSGSSFDGDDDSQQQRREELQLGRSFASFSKGCSCCCWELWKIRQHQDDDDDATCNACSGRGEGSVGRELLWRSGLLVPQTYIWPPRPATARDKGDDVGEVSAVW